MLEEANGPVFAGAGVEELIVEGAREMSEEDEE